MGGVVAGVTVHLDPCAVTALVADLRVRRISFTGSPEAARRIDAAAARNIVPFTAELDGKSPFILVAT